MYSRSCIALGGGLAALCAYGLYWWSHKKDEPSSDKLSPEDKLVPSNVPEPEESRAISTKHASQIIKTIQHTLRDTFPEQRFLGCKPDWLKTLPPKHRHLHCYNDELKLAVIYANPKRFKRPKSPSVKIPKSSLDTMKKLCFQNGVTLIVIDYDVKLEDVKSVLLNELQRLGFIKEL